MKTSDVCTPSSSSSSRLTVELDKAVQRVVQKVLDEHLFPDGFDASQVAAQLKAEFLRGVVGRRTLEDAVARSVDASAGKPPPLRPAPRPTRAVTYATSTRSHHRITLTHTRTRTRTPFTYTPLDGHFPDKPKLASCRLDFPSPYIILRIY